MLRPVRNVKPGDHSADRRMILLSAMAVIVGLLVALGAWVLLKMIAFSTNLFWYQRFSFQEVEITDANVGLWVLAIPVIGALIIGIMARFGSEKIRGHGIPEAMETILYGESRLSPKIAILKPVSAAISLGSGGPFGAEGPIIMTGGAIGSLFAQLFQSAPQSARPCSPPVPPGVWRRFSARRRRLFCWPLNCCFLNGSRAVSSPW